ncbi:hypothetical protein SKAU_G00226010 [Synaphobranchus kaupii]|uniref:Uncharacterized protein n=1 Tax=Synaphobranchus kaupii TaxID=118154 RepID=A0A9Q1FC04_SYNKA|nr:hypothetical protein SKAU_G00226010 [Synaphobranchus kaupii]
MFPPLAPWDKNNTVPRGHGIPWLVPVVSWPALGQLERAENQCSLGPGDGQLTGWKSFSQFIPLCLDITLRLKWRQRPLTVSLSTTGLTVSPSSDLRYTLTVTLLLRSVGWGVSRTVYSQLSGTSVYNSAGASPWISSLPVTVK